MPNEEQAEVVQTDTSAEDEAIEAKAIEELDKITDRNDAKARGDAETVADNEGDEVESTPETEDDPNEDQDGEDDEIELTQQELDAGKYHGISSETMKLLPQGRRDELVNARSILDREASRRGRDPEGDPKKEDEASTDAEEIIEYDPDELGEESAKLLNKQAADIKEMKDRLDTIQRGQKHIDEQRAEQECNAIFADLDPKTFGTGLTSSLKEGSAEYEARWDLIDEARSQMEAQNLRGKTITIAEGMDRAIKILHPNAKAKADNLIEAKKKRHKQRIAKPSSSASTGTVERNDDEVCKDALDPVMRKHGITPVD